jgi:predicted DNA-binding transcriptional regulator YafY
MSTRTSFLRYTFIIKKLQNFGKATFEEINRCLYDEFDLLDEPVQISQRTLQRDLIEIRSLFGIEIQCNAQHQYYIEEEGQPEFNTRMLEAFDVFNSLRVGQPLSPYILTENHCPAGTVHLFSLLHAIRNSLTIRFEYQKYYEDAPTSRTVQPLGMKEFRGRWYLVARNVDDKRIRVFGTDRISNLEVTTKKFPYPTDFSLADYYKHSFGVTRPDDQEPEEIILSFSPIEGKYTKAFPLHHSQEILIDSKEEFRIRIRVLITYDLIMELRSYGKTLTVIQPKDLLKDKG